MGAVVAVMNNKASAISASVQTAALASFAFWERRPRLACAALAAVSAMGLAVVYLKDRAGACRAALRMIQSPP